MPLLAPLIGNFLDALTCFSKYIFSSFKEAISSNFKSVTAKLNNFEDLLCNKAKQCFIGSTNFRVFMNSGNITPTPTPSDMGTEVINFKRIEAVIAETRQLIIRAGDGIRNFNANIPFWRARGLNLEFPFDENNRYTGLTINVNNNDTYSDEQINNRLVPDIRDDDLSLLRTLQKLRDRITALTRLSVSRLNYLEHTVVVTRIIVLEREALELYVEYEALNGHENDEPSVRADTIYNSFFTIASSHTSKSSKRNRDNNPFGEGSSNKKRIQ